MEEGAYGTALYAVLASSWTTCRICLCVRVAKKIFGSFTAELSRKDEQTLNNTGMHVTGVHKYLFGCLFSNASLLSSSSLRLLWQSHLVQGIGGATGLTSPPASVPGALLHCSASQPPQEGNNHRSMQSSPIEDSTLFAIGATYKSWIKLCHLCVCVCVCVCMFINHVS